MEHLCSVVAVVSPGYHGNQYGDHGEQQAGITKISIWQIASILNAFI